MPHGDHLSFYGVAPLYANPSPSATHVGAVHLAEPLQPIQAHLNQFLRERAENLGGRLAIHSRQPQGTEIQVTGPVWVLAFSSGDYTHDEGGMEQALLEGTLRVLNGGDPSGFAAFAPAFGGCYVDLLVSIRQGKVLVEVVGAGLCHSYCATGRPALCENGNRANVAGCLLDCSRHFRDPQGRELQHHLGVSAFARYTVAAQESLIGRSRCRWRRQLSSAVP